MENSPDGPIVCSDIICKVCNCSSDIRKEYQKRFIACVACGFLRPIGFVDGTAECKIDQSSNGLHSSSIFRAFDDNLPSGDLEKNSFVDKDSKNNISEKKLTWIEKIHLKGISLMNEWASALKLEQKIISTALEKFEHLLKIKKFHGQGRNVERVISSLIYWASKREKNPISPKQLEIVSGETIREIRKAFVFISKIDPTVLVITKPSDFVDNFGSSLNLPPAVVEKTKSLLDFLEINANFEGKNPRSMAGAAIYLIGISENNKIDMGEISKMSNISRNTISITCELIYLALKNLSVYNLLNEWNCQKKLFL